jgi:hypothetical protein
MEEIALHVKPPLILAILHSALKSFATGCIFSTIAANATSALGLSSVSVAWVAGAAIGSAFGPFLDFGELGDLKGLVREVAEPDRHYPNAAIHTPDQKGIVRLKFYIPFEIIAIEGAIRVFIVQQTWRQYASDLHLKDTVKRVCTILSIEGGLFWCSLASLVRHHTGLLRAGDEVVALFVGPVAALVFLGLIELLSRRFHLSIRKSTDVTKA